MDDTVNSEMMSSTRNLDSFRFFSLREYSSTMTGSSPSVWLFVMIFGLGFLAVVSGRVDTPVPL